MNTPEDEVEESVSRVEEKDMARLFEGMELDIQAERKKLRAERQELAEERKQLLEKSDGMIQSFIRVSAAEGKSEEDILKNLVEIFELGKEAAWEQIKNPR